ncbi:Caleosin related protein-domain-containing protein [Daldinia bambusicola]|nr:Caleosin related protein-domain-containing protein [Daldinia bambusicola]
MKNSREAKKPADEHVEHCQRLRSRRLSMRQREDPKTPTTTRQGQAGQQAPEIVLPQQVDLAAGRRRASASGKSSSGIPGPNEPQTYRTHHQQRKSRSIDSGVAVKGVKMATLEESELTAGSAKPPVPEVRAIPWDLPKESTPKEPAPSTMPNAAYEPAYLLRQNAAYFDTDQDGVIWLRDTYKGCRKLGSGITYSCLSAFILHSILSYPTGHSYIPDPLLRIRYDCNSNGGHASYDEKGQTRRDQVCESILTKYDSGNKGGMDIRDILHFWRDQRPVSTFYSWSLTVLEWLILYLALRQPDGIVPGEDIRAAFDGSIFFKRSEMWQRKNDMHHKHTVKAARSGDEDRSNKQFDPVKLAVAIVIGLAITIWALPGLLRNHPNWGKYWRVQDDTPEGVALSNPGLVDD